MAEIIAETARLVIRRLREEDIPTVAALWCAPRVTRFLGGPRVFSDVCCSLRSDLSQSPPARFDLWPVVEKANASVIGHCGLLDKEIEGRTEIEVVYVITPPAWGHGYATEAARALRIHAEQGLGCHRLVALVHPDNRPSAHVAEKVGLAFERLVERPQGTMRLYAGLRRLDPLP